MVMLKLQNSWKRKFWRTAYHQARSWANNSSNTVTPHGRATYTPRRVRREKRARAFFGWLTMPFPTIRHCPPLCILPSLLQLGWPRVPPPGAALLPLSQHQHRRLQRRFVLGFQLYRHKNAASWSQNADLPNSALQEMGAGTTPIISPSSSLPGHTFSPRDGLRSSQMQIRYSTQRLTERKPVSILIRLSRSRSGR